MSYPNQPPYPQQPDPYQQPQQPYPQQPSPYEAPNPASYPQQPPQPLYPNMPDPNQAYPQQPQPQYPQPPYPQPQYPPQQPQGYPQPSPYPQPQQPPPYPPAAGSGYGAPPYGQVPSGAPPYQQGAYGIPYPQPSPTPNSNQSQRTLLGIVAGVVVVALIVVGIIIYANQHHPGTSTSTVTALYSSTAPACSDAAKWTASSNVQKTCASNAVTLTVPSSAQTIGEIFLNLNTFPSSYIVKVHISNLQNGCAGASVLRNNYEGYDGYVCSDGKWKIIRYDSSGNPSVEQNGTLSGNATDYQMELDLVNGKLTLKINGATQGTPVTIMSGYTTTNLSLVVDHDTSGNNGSADFSNYVLDPA